MASLFPTVINRACFEVAWRGKERLETKLRVALENDPIEDGIDHPAELVIDEALQSKDEQRVLEWLKALSVNSRRPGFAASVLRCMGRLRLGTSAWRVEVVRSALAADDVEMRDAAVQAAESWGGREMRNVLRGHSEVVPWLRSYIEYIVRDLGE